MQKVSLIVEKILLGFNLHYSRFMQITSGAKFRFEVACWHKIQQANRIRISFYEKRVRHTVAQLKHSRVLFPFEPGLWLAVKQDYADHLAFHPQAELAETFFNSVFCRLFDRRYFNNQYIFVNSSLKYTTQISKHKVYTSYFPSVHGLLPTIKQAILSFAFNNQFTHLMIDIKALIKAFSEQTQLYHLQNHQIRFDILNTPFFRNKAAYIVGRITLEHHSQPFIVPILMNSQQKLYLDAIVTGSEHISVMFSFTRAYFMVETEVPSALIDFLNELIPNKTKAELYACLGFHKQSKTEFYRALLHQLHHRDRNLFIAAPGVQGMVMEVFTLPSFPYVFKVIKDKFAPSKNFSRNVVEQRYRLVKRHDRVGRMADTLEFSNVALPLASIHPDLLIQLQRTIPSSLLMVDEQLILKHVYIERRMIPLNLYLQTAGTEEVIHVMREFGQAIKEMVAANIFPGDMLLKNFGVTRHNRVVFYDYDEVQYLLDMNFRSIPLARTEEDELAGEPWYSIAPNDVFPEQLLTFITPNPKLKALLLKLHPELAQPEFWQQKQENIRQGVLEDIYPYPYLLRLRERIYQKKLPL